MIEYINARMIEWARWVKRREDGGLGYPSEANFVNIISIHGTAGPGLITEDAAPMEIEGIMRKIREERPDRYKVAYWVYLAGSLTMDRVASELHCHRITVYTRLHALHQEIMHELEEITLAAKEKQQKSKK